MRKAKTKFDIDLLLTINIPNPTGSEGGHPMVEMMKRKYKRNPNEAFLFYEKVHKAQKNNPRMAFLEQIRDKKND